MTNNANFNLTNKLFAYISYGVDLSDNIAQQYKNSLIFIGDEHQIYVPAKNAYVGVGMTSYNYTVNALNDLKERVDNIVGDASSTTVQRLYSNWSPNDSSIIYTSDNYQYVVGEATLRGLGEYDANTGFAYIKRQYQDSNGVWHDTTHSNDWHSNNIPATSGITVSYTQGVLTIDDRQTWAYMTTAYAHAMTSSREYTNKQIESLYRELLGTEGGSEWFMMPVQTSFLFDEAGNHNGTAAYAKDDPFGDPPLHGTGDPETLGWRQVTPNIDGGPYYVKTSGGPITYNTNIANGIQTLKEVAYILDKISDGALGSTTYITASQWTTIGGDATETSHTDTDTGITYYRVITNGRPTSNETAYAYYVKAADPENLGIQIAYSIAGNSADISDLHYHINLEENGETTLRSIHAKTTEMMNIVQLSNKNFVQTDTNSSLPNDINTTYTVGDTNLLFDLDLASTYLTKESNPNTNPQLIKYGVKYRGLYQKADKFELAGQPITANTYYYDVAGTLTAISTNSLDFGTGSGAFLPIDQLLDKPDIWYVGQSKSYTYINATFKSIDSLVDFENNTKPLYKQHTSGTNVGQFYVVTEGTTWDNGPWFTKESDGDPNKLHAVRNDNDNKIATTAWTLALFNDMNVNTGGTFDPASVKNTVDEAINELDTIMAYSSFSWDNPNDLIQGSTPYINAFNDARNAWYNTYVAGWELGGTYMNTTTGILNDFGKVAYVQNRIRSQYISNIKEEDGIIYVTETNELPTDELLVSTSIWGNQDSTDFNKEYSEIDLSNVTVSNSPSGIVDDTDLEKLFYYVNGLDNPQIYYKDGTTYTPVSGTAGDGTYYKYDSNTNSFVTIDNTVDKPNFNRGIINSAKWVQLYELKDAYYEVDLATIKVDASTKHIIEFKYNKYDENGDPSTWNGSETPTFYKVDDSSLNYSTKYITAKGYHYDWQTDNGEGQNRFMLTTHITHLEDASPINTGLADAWDIASFIENMCEWVDISASIDDQHINPLNLAISKTVTQ